MSFINPIQQLFSNPGAFAQSFDDSFLLLTNSSFSKEMTDLYQFKIVDTITNSKLFIPTFFNFSENCLKEFNYCLKIERVNIISLLESYLNSLEITHLFSQPKWELQNRILFDLDFNKIQDQIQRAQIDKAVVMTTEKSDWHPSLNDRILMLLNLLIKCPKHLYIYSHWSNSSGVIGATPEFLYHRNGQMIQTMALAGTLDKRKLKSKKTTLGITGSQQLETIEFIENQKELSEHQYVIDDLTEKLETVSVDTKIYGPRVVEFPHLFHLQTEIHARLSEVPNLESFDYQLTEKLHPSSALGLRSKKIHWHWLKELNGHLKLGHFGAPIGIRIPDGYFCLVGIRNLEWDDKESYLRAGSGIVAQSNADSEWQELEAKRESVKSLLGLTQNSSQIKNQDTGFSQITENLLSMNRHPHVLSDQLELTK